MQEVIVQLTVYLNESNHYGIAVYRRAALFKELERLGCDEGEIEQMKHALDEKGYCFEPQSPPRDKKIKEIIYYSRDLPPRSVSKSRPDDAKKASHRRK